MLIEVTVSIEMTKELVDKVKGMAGGQGFIWPLLHEANLWADGAQNKIKNVTFKEINEAQEGHAASNGPTVQAGSHS